MQETNASSSRLHWKTRSDSFPEKAKEALEDLEAAGGVEFRRVFGSPRLTSRPYDLGQINTRSILPITFLSIIIFDIMYRIRFFVILGREINVRCQVSRCVRQAMNR